MKRKHNSTQADIQCVLDAFRKIVKSLRDASKLTEKHMGLSAAQLFVLQKIAESDKPLSINDLAERTLTHQSSVSVVVAKLVKQRLVERLSSKTDGRAVALKLSKKGKKIAQRGPPLIQQQLVDGIAALKIHERRGLVIGLRALLKKSGLQKEVASMFFEDDKGEKV